MTAQRETRISDARLAELLDWYERIANSPMHGASVQIACESAQALRELAALRREWLVLVPREPTQKMIAAMLNVRFTGWTNPEYVDGLYRAMLAAAPKPSTG